MSSFIQCNGRSTISKHKTDGPYGRRGKGEHESRLLTREGREVEENKRNLPALQMCMPSKHFPIPCAEVAKLRSENWSVRAERSMRGDTTYAGSLTHNEHPVQHTFHLHLRVRITSSCSKASLSPPNIRFQSASNITLFSLNIVWVTLVSRLVSLVVSMVHVGSRIPFHVLIHRSALPFIVLSPVDQL